MYQFNGSKVFLPREIHDDCQVSGVYLGGDEVVSISLDENQLEKVRNASADKNLNGNSVNDIRLLVLVSESSATVFYDPSYKILLCQSYFKNQDLVVVKTKISSEFPSSKHQELVVFCDKLLPASRSGQGVIVDIDGSVFELTEKSQIHSLPNSYLHAVATSALIIPSEVIFTEMPLSLSLVFLSTESGLVCKHRLVAEIMTPASIDSPEEAPKGLARYLRYYQK